MAPVPYNPLVSTGKHSKLLWSKSPGAPLGRLAFFVVFCCAAVGRHCLADHTAQYAFVGTQKCCLSAACQPVRPRRLLLAAVWAASCFCPSGGGRFLRRRCSPARFRIRLVKSCYCLACLSVSPVCVCVCGCQCLCLVCLRLSVPVLHSIA